MPSDFPTSDMEMSVLLVVSNPEKSRVFYRDVLGAELFREYSDTSVFKFQGTWLIVTTAGEPTKDKPTVTMTPPSDPDKVSCELTIRVPDCQGAYETLQERGAEFLTPPVNWGHEIRAFFRDPDGHLFEISELVKKS